MDIWKSFDQNIITHSAAHHLMAIDDLIGKLGYARVSDIARALNITRGSVSISLQPLKKAGLVLQDENRHLRLSPDGQELVDAIKAKRLVVQQFFATVLGVTSEQAEIDACKMEHLLSESTARRLASFLRFVDTDKHVGRKFASAWRNFQETGDGAANACPLCETDYLTDRLTE
ncbi:MAG: metal-dependent transcriptional regulator [Planctomycetes bacterium]|nr:metal-dependent transcriptional regulator [Planctomycetota bacterium]